MRYKSVSGHLRPFSIVKKRTTTINHAFASAIAPVIPYDEAAIREAIQFLGQDPDEDLHCVYCGGFAETWDHVEPTVKKKMFSGVGHSIGNLVPCCKPCNSRKGGKPWSQYLAQAAGSEFEERHALIDRHLKRYAVPIQLPGEIPEYKELLRIREKVLDLFAEADRVAARLRQMQASIQLEMEKSS